MDNYQALARYYDRFTDDVAYTGWADFFQAVTEREKVQPKLVLDLACGTGTLTRLLARRGYEMIGVDASEDMLMQAMQYPALSEGVPPMYLHQKMEQLDLYGTIDACVCCLDSINYVTAPAALQRAFQRVFLFLEPHTGLFVFDVNAPAKFRRMDGNSYVREADGVFCVWQAAVKDNLCAYQFDIFEANEKSNWNRAQECHEERIYQPEELEKMLVAAGFCDIRFYGDLDFSPFTERSDRIYITARKG